MFKLEFDTTDLLMAELMGRALIEYSENTRTLQAAAADLCEYTEPDVKTNEAFQPPAEPGADVDEHGVEFDATFCAKAKVPFYESGKRKGQWKKRKGTADEVYDNWYSGELDEEEEDEPDTAAAFTPPAAPGAPATAGDMIGWISERQASGALTQDMVSQIYTNAGLAVESLFVDDPEAVKASCAKLYGVATAMGVK